MGWFYGFKLHLVCNEKGELFILLFNERQYGRKKPKTHQKNDKTTFRKTFRKNMKNHITNMEDKILFHKREIEL